MDTLTSRDESSQLSLHALSLFRALSLNDNVVIDDDYDKQVDDNERQRQRLYNYYTEIEGIVQIETWDCGIACLLMISRWLREEEEKDKDDDDDKKNNNNVDAQQQEDQIVSERSDILSDGVQTKSIWTSDLMWQLHLWEKINKMNRSTTSTSSSPFLFDFVLASQQLMDVDEAYKDFQYYQNNFVEDQRRIAYTFQELYKERVPMIQTATTTTTAKTKITNADDDDDDDDGNNNFLSLFTVIEIVRRDDCVAIVLLDNCVLLHHKSVDDSNDHDVDDSGGDNNNNNANNNNNDDQPYAGHYVVLCGISYDPRHLEIANNHEKCQLAAQSRATATTISKDKTNYECDTNNNNNNSNNKKSTNNNCQEQRTDFCFVLRNPSPSSCWKTINPNATDDLPSLEYMFVTPKRFEASWRASGTDHDIIFIRKKRLVTVTTKAT